MVANGINIAKALSWTGCVDSDRLWVLALSPLSQCTIWWVPRSLEMTAEHMGRKIFWMSVVTLSNMYWYNCLLRVLLSISTHADLQHRAPRPALSPTHTRDHMLLLANRDKSRWRMKTDDVSLGCLFEKKSRLKSRSGVNVAVTKAMARCLLSDP